MGLVRAVVRVLAQDDDLDLVPRAEAEGAEHQRLGRVDGLRKSRQVRQEDTSQRTRRGACARRLDAPTWLLVSSLLRNSMSLPK